MLAERKTDQGKGKVPSRGQHLRWKIGQGQNRHGRAVADIMNTLTHRARKDLSNWEMHFTPLHPMDNSQLIIDLNVKDKTRTLF